MAEHINNSDASDGNRFRMVAWSFAAGLLLLPLIAMQFTDEVAWDINDFVVFAAMLISVGLVFEMVARMTSNNAYRAAAGVALVAAFLLTWLSLGVGIIGKDGDPANLMYFGVIAVGITGAFMAHFKPRGMARALFAAALAQLLVAVITLTIGLGLPYSTPFLIVAANGFFIALFIGSALLFRYAAQGQ